MAQKMKLLKVKQIKDKMKILIDLTSFALILFFLYHGWCFGQKAYNETYYVSVDNCGIIHYPTFCYYTTKKEPYGIKIIYNEEECKRIPFDFEKKCYKLDKKITDEQSLHFDLESIWKETKEDNKQITFDFTVAIVFFNAAYICYMLRRELYDELKSIKVQ